jgi:hypothetical protein
MQLKLQARLVESELEILNKIGKIMAAEFNKTLKKAAKTIQYRVRILVRKRITQSKTFIDLFRTRGQSEANASLRVHLGLERPAQQVLPIMRRWVRSVVVRPRTIGFSGGKFNGGLSVEFIRDDWADVLHMDEASYISIGTSEHQRLTERKQDIGKINGKYITASNPQNKFTNSRGGKTLRTVPWLAWLLLGGSAPLVQNFHIVFGNFSTSRLPGQHLSRTGKAIMAFQKGSFWRMPIEHAGTSQDNFVTRALDGIETEVTKIVEDELNRYFGDGTIDNTNIEPDSFGDTLGE